jgi:uncharacterized protein (DUF433 family)
MTRIDVFAAEHASQHTGLSRNQLAAWDRGDILHPHWSRNGHGSPRVYSFHDLVVLRTLAILRQEYRVTPAELRRVAEWLNAHTASPWVDLRLTVNGRHVQLENGDAGSAGGDAPRNGHGARLHLEAVARDTEAILEAAQRRQPDEIGQVVRRRGVMGNVPILAGTRIPTSAVWNFHEDGYSAEQIIYQYPRLTPKDIEAAIAYERQRRSSFTCSLPASVATRD